jgi:hypothetical protein
MKKSILLTTLAGLILASPNLEAKVKRNNISLDTGVTTQVVNKERFSTGLSQSLEADLNFDLTPWLNLRATTDFNFQAHTLKYKKLQEYITNLDTTLEARAKIYASKDLKLFVGMGARHFLDDDKLILNEKTTHATRNNLGPMVGLNLESKYFDAHIQGSLLFAEKKTSYDIDRDERMLRLNLKLIPRYGIFSIPTTFSYYFGEKINTRIDRVNQRYVFKIQPTLDVTDNVGVFLSLKGLVHRGTDDYEIYQATGGMRFKF